MVTKNTERNLVFIRNPGQNTTENVMDVMVIMGIVLVLMKNILVSTGMCWILLVGC